MAKRVKPLRTVTTPQDGPEARESGWRTTVMARLSSSFVNDTLWPEFLELQDTLASYFDALTDRVIEQALEVKAGEADECGDEDNTPTPAPRLEPVVHQNALL